MFGRNSEKERIRCKERESERYNGGRERDRVRDLLLDMDRGWLAKSKREVDKTIHIGMTFY